MRYDQPFFVPHSKRHLVKGVNAWGYLPPLELPQEAEDLDDRINDLESLSAQPGSVPQYYHDRIEQLQGKLNFLQNKMNEHVDKPRGRRQTKARGVVQL